MDDNNATIMYYNTLAKDESWRVNDLVGRNMCDAPSVFPEGAFAEGDDSSERVPERWRIDAGGWIPPAASVKLIAEYDSRTFDMGFTASFWDDRFEAMFELMAMKWVNFGVRYKLALKKASDK